MARPPAPGAAPPPRGPRPDGDAPRPSDSFSPFPALSGRRRLLIALLAAVTAIGIVWLMLDPPGGVQRKRPPPPPDVARCAPGQTQDCVGSPTQVRIAPAASVQPALPAGPAPGSARRP